MDTLVDDDERFTSLVDELAHADAYGLDAEFHGESTYYPRLAVLQVATPARTAVVDATRVDVPRLRPVLEGPGLMVAHAGEQDLQVLLRSAGATLGGWDLAGTRTDWCPFTIGDLRG